MWDCETKDKTELAGNLRTFIDHRTMEHPNDTMDVKAGVNSPTCNPLVTLTSESHRADGDFNRPENEKTAEFRGFEGFGNLERAKGFEPSTPTLARLCSTPELHPLARRQAASRAYMAEPQPDCNRENRLVKS